MRLALEDESRADLEDAATLAEEPGVLDRHVAPAAGHDDHLDIGAQACLAFCRLALPAAAPREKFPGTLQRRFDESLLAVLQRHVQSAVGTPRGDVSAHDASADDVIAHYRGQAEATGYTIEMEMTTQGSTIIGGTAASGATFSVSVAPGADGGPSMVQLTMAE